MKIQLLSFTFIAASVLRVASTSLGNSPRGAKTGGRILRKRGGRKKAAKGGIAKKFIQKPPFSFPPIKQRRFCLNQGISENLLASLGSTHFANLWNSVVSTGCDADRIGRVYDRFWTPDASITLFGGDIGINGLDAVRASFIGTEEDPRGNLLGCRGGVVVSWHVYGAEAIDCNTMRVFAVELSAPGVDPDNRRLVMSLQQEANKNNNPQRALQAQLNPREIPNGREYTIVLDRFGRTLIRNVNIICPVDIAINQVDRCTAPP